MNMPTLAQQARWMPRTRRWLMALAVVAGLGLLGAEVLPRLARMAELQANESAISQQLAMSDAEMALLKPAMRQGLALNAATNRDALTSDPDSWVRRITDMSGGDRLRAVTVQAGLPEQHDDIWRLPLILNFEGDYLDACTFLQDAEKLPGVVRVSKLHVHCTDLPTGQVEVQVAMEAYLPEEP